MNSRLKPFLSESPVEQRREEDRVVFTIDGKPFTNYVPSDPEASRPYFYPLMGPGGASMTRSYPMEQRPGETADHPHHRSLWASFGDVDGVDNWQDHTVHGYTRFRSLEPADESAPGRLCALSDWEAGDGRLLLHERLETEIFAMKDEARLIDWRLTLTAPADRDVHFFDTKEGGLCSLRVATPLDGDKHGQIRNAEGGVGEKQCWGKRARWCDYAGTLPDIDGTVGLAILDHPESFRFPTPWHVRDYGLFTANPFGLGAFTGGKENGNYTLPAGKSVLFHYAVLVHRGDADAAQIDAIWRAWSGRGG